MALTKVPADPPQAVKSGSIHTECILGAGYYSAQLTCHHLRLDQPAHPNYSSTVQFRIAKIRAWYDTGAIGICKW